MSLMPIINVVKQLPKCEVAVTRGDDHHINRLQFRDFKSYSTAHRTLQNWLLNHEAEVPDFEQIMYDAYSDSYVGLKP